jgi:hypothetical protein
MEICDDRRRPREVSIPSLIGWLSLCLLTAAYGRTLDDRWQPIWVHLGLFGLVSAFGLGRVEAARSARIRWKHFRTLQSRLEQRAAKFTEQSATIETINAGVGKLRKYVQEAHNRSTKLGRGPRCSRAAMLAHLPLQVIPVQENGDELDRNSAEAIHGSLRSISSQSVAFDHVEPFATQLVLLDFQLGPDERLSFVVDVIWSQHNKRGGGFSSGGTVLAVGVPTDPDDHALQSTVIETAAPASVA